jgi:hypothetical protein
MVKYRRTPHPQIKVHALTVEESTIVVNALELPSHVQNAISKDTLLNIVKEFKVITRIGLRRRKKIQVIEAELMVPMIKWSVLLNVQDHHLSRARKLSFVVNENIHIDKFVDQK